MSDQIFRHIPGADLVRDDASQGSLAIRPDTQGIQAGGSDIERPLKTDQGVKPVVLVASGALHGCEKHGPGMTIKKPLQDFKEPTMTAESVIQLKIWLHDVFLRIEDHKVRVPLAYVNAHVITFHHNSFSGKNTFHNKCQESSPSSNPVSLHHVIPRL